MCIATEQEEIAEDEENNEVLIQNFTKKSKPSEIKSKENNLNESEKTVCLLQVGNAKIRNPKNGQVCQNTAIFLDSGYEISLVRNSFANPNRS